MKTEIIIYKILSFVLLPVAAFFGLVCLLGLMAALSYPPMLINVFLLACMVIYIIVSFIFLNKGVDAGRKCKPVLRDLIRINGVITLIFFLLVMISFIMLKNNPALLDAGIKQWSNNTTLPAGVSEAELRNATVSVSNFFLSLSIVLVVHVLITFHLMRQYRYVFEPERMDIEEELESNN